MYSTCITVFATILVLLLQISNGLSNPLKPAKFQDSNECRDDRDDCYKIPAKGDELKAYCKYWKAKGDPAVIKCRRTCGLCKAPFPPNECEDQRDDCNWLVENLGTRLQIYCQEYQDDDAVKMCAKTCGFCKKPPSPTIPPTKGPLPPLPGTPHPHPQSSPPQPKTSPPQPKTSLPQPKTQTPKPKLTLKPTGGEMTGFEKECLSAHNKLRAIHHSPALVWSKELAKDAQYWANKLANDNLFKHDPKLRELGQGENLAYFKPTKRMCDGPSEQDCVHCGEFVKDWYDEIKDYSFSKGEGNYPWSVVLHFTQVVWKGTTEIGMATAHAHNRVVAVARYKPVGNQGSNKEFKKNVLPVTP